MESDSVFSGNGPKPTPLSLSRSLFLRSSHIQSVSDDRWRARSGHRRQCLSHDLRGPRGHWGEKTEQVRDKQQQVWARICKEVYFLWFPFTGALTHAILTQNLYYLQSRDVINNPISFPLSGG